MTFFWGVLEFFLFDFFFCFRVFFVFGGYYSLVFMHLPSVVFLFGEVLLEVFFVPKGVNADVLQSGVLEGGSFRTRTLEVLAFFRAHSNSQLVLP